MLYGYGMYVNDLVCLVASVLQLYRIILMEYYRRVYIYIVSLIITNRMFYRLFFSNIVDV